MFTRIASVCIATFCLTVLLGGCKSAEQRSWLVGGKSDSVMMGMFAAPVAPDADATGAIQLGAGDALGFQLYMNHVAYVHGQRHNGSMFATGENDAPRD